jgi:hypothetical protein
MAVNSERAGARQRQSRQAEQAEDADFCLHDGYCKRLRRTTKPFARTTASCLRQPPRAQRCMAGENEQRQLIRRHRFAMIMTVRRRQWLRRGIVANDNCNGRYRKVRGKTADARFARREVQMAGRPQPNSNNQPANPVSSWLSNLKSDA